MRQRANEGAAKLEAQRHLPLDLLVRTCGLLSPNEIACTARLINKSLAQRFSEERHRTVRLSQPVPSQPFAARYGRGADPEPLRQLTLHQKERLLALTASSGVLENVATLVKRMELPFCWKVPCIGRHTNDACAAAARNGHMRIVRFLMARGYPLDVDAVMPAVLQHCALPDVQWLLCHKAVQDSPIAQGELTKDGLRAAASSTVPNATAKLEWLQSRDWRLEGNQLSGQRLLWRIAEAAAGGDNLHGLQWALGQMGNVTVAMRQSLLRAAACGNALSVTAWLLEQEGVVAAADTAALEAIEVEHVKVAGALRLLLPHALEKQQTRDTQTRLLKDCLKSAAYEQVDAALLVAEVAAAHGLEEAAAPDADLAARALEEIASSHGSMEEARQLWQRHAGPAHVAKATGAVFRAIRACNMPMLRFLVEEVGVPWENGQYSSWCYLQQAAVSSVKGEEVVAVLQWLHEWGCPLAWTKQSIVPFSEALTGGKVAVLQWMRSNVIDPEDLSDYGGRLAYEAAVRGGCEAVVEWLHGAGCPVGQDGKEYRFAAKNGDLDMLRCLRRLGVPSGPDTVRWAEEESDCIPMHVIRWMVEEGGAPCDERAVEAAPDGSGLRALLRSAARKAAESAAKGGAAKGRKGRRRT